MQARMRRIMNELTTGMMASASAVRICRRRITYNTTQCFIYYNTIYTVLIHSNAMCIL